VPGQKDQALTGGHIPIPGSAVCAGRHDTAAIGADDGNRRRGAVRHSRANRFTGRGVPDLGCPVFGGRKDVSTNCVESGEAHRGAVGPKMNKARAVPQRDGDAYTVRFYLVGPTLGQIQRRGEPG
jgi:hypothetical protein